MTMNRIVLFSTEYLPDIGGVENHVHELARALQFLGHKTCVLTVRGGSWRRPSTWLSRRPVYNRVQTLELSLAALPLGRGIYWRLRKSSQRFLRKFYEINGKAVIHCHDYEPYGHCVVENYKDAARVFTNHTSMFLQEFDDPRKHSEWRRRLMLYDWVIAPSQELADRTVAVGYDAERVSVIPNGVDAERFTPDCDLRSKVRSELAVPEEDFVVLCARRVVPKNGVIDFAHSLRFLSGYANRMTVLFAGNGNSLDLYETETLDVAKRSPLGKRVRFLGGIPNAQMHRLYVAADLAVLPSLKEATSITGLEAMSCGIPLVGTRVGGIPDLIEHGRTGLLVEPGDPRELAQALAQLVVNTDMCRELGKRARAKVLDRFTWKQIAVRTHDVYEQAIEIALSHRKQFAHSQMLGRQVRAQP